MANLTLIKSQPVAADWLAGGGEMGERMRALDWTQTALGAAEAWPQSLRSAVSICIGSRFPIVLYWGPQRVVLYNDAYAEILGGKHPLALGRPCEEVWSEIWDVIGPMLDGVVATGQATWSEDQLLVLERRGYPEECYFSFSFSPVRGEDGSVEGIFTAVIESTGRVVGERRLALLADLAAGSAARSAREACEQTMRKLAGKPDVPFALAYLKGDSKDDVSEHLVAATPGAEAARAAARAQDVTDLSIPGGSLTIGANSRRPLDDGHAAFFQLIAGQLGTAISGARAYEEEKKRAEALSELDRAKTMFFSNVSHEFRTPLTLILGPLEDLLAKGEDSLPAAGRALAAAAQRNAKRLLKLVNTLLDFARIEAGRAQASFQPTDLATLTADLASNFRSACEHAGLDLAVDCAPLAEPAYVDREMWEKIVLNLLSNAFKFTFKGAISVRLRDAGACFELSVSDTGTGIPIGELGRVFDRFHRVEEARGRSHEGSGIGLALVNELVKLHRGAIAVQSSPGEGTCFTVTIAKGSDHLPAAQVKEAEPASAGASRADAYVAEVLGWLPSVDAEPAQARPDVAPRILLADDSPDLRAYVSRLLAKHYDVEAVADGRAAMEAARARRPELIISDVMMPRLDGFGLIRELRADPALRSIPVMLLSARAGEEARVEGLGQGADDYLVKPFNSNELLVRAGALVRSAEMHRRAEEARAQFETLLNEAPLGVYVVDDEFRIAAANPVARPMFGDIPDLIGRDFEEVMHVLWPKPYADEVVQIFRRTLQTGQPHVVPERIEQRLDRKVTEYYEWQINRIPLPGNRQGLVCYFRDISKPVMVREALREADSRKDEFLATLSHELRNPLAPLRNSLEMLKLAGARGVSPGQALGIMERQLSHLVRLVDDLMEVSRITRGSVELRKEPVTLEVILRNAIEASDPLIRAGRHRLSLALPQEPMTLDADPVRLAQVFGNLLNNAARYSDHGGAISIEARREAGQAVVSISDTGEGIEPEQLQQLFKIFVRGSRSARRNQSGLGIGLALVRQLTEMHGGTVEAESEGLGKGSRFTVRLPLGVTLQVVPTGKQPQSAASAPIKILVVDDNQDAATSLQLLLAQFGADVRIAHDGPEAVAAFAAWYPRMVLLDIGMPGMDGYEVAGRLRATAGRERVSIVALTGWGQEDDRERARSAGFDHHLVKPADLGALQLLIAAVHAEDAANGGVAGKPAL